MLGSALMGYTYRNVSQFVFGSNNPPVVVLPVDAVGRFFGAFWFKRFNITTDPFNELYATIDRANNPTAGARIVIDFRRNATVLATTQIWNKRQWRIDQRYSDAATSSWRNTTSTGSDARVWNWTPQPPVAPWVFLSPALGSYGNAYFPPAGWPANTPSTTPNANAFVLSVHAEPFYVTFDRNDGDTLDFRIRAFADRPNSALGVNAINDDPPPADFGVRSAEIEIPFDPFVPDEPGHWMDGWLVRIGPTDAEQITTIPNDPNWGTSGT